MNDMNDTHSDDLVCPDCADQTENATEENATEENAIDEPSYMQLAITFSMLLRNELLRGNEKYDADYFYSSPEALGVLTVRCSTVDFLLKKIRIVAGRAMDQDSIDYLPALLEELVKLAAMCMKTALSLCDMREQAEEINKLMREAQAMAEILKDKEGNS